MRGYVIRSLFFLLTLICLFFGLQYSQQDNFELVETSVFRIL